MVYIVDAENKCHVRLYPSPLKLTGWVQHCRVYVLHPYVYNIGNVSSGLKQSLVLMKTGKTAREYQRLIWLVFSVVQRRFRRWVSMYVPYV